ncbi:unnamed protein product [Ranitomeya imitator]|uniref:Tetraspanin n=1 Tax=Ranitomeya imitator TaxID=111125 RepID=A0ABN9LNE6_9NEOB|nr:unnamed protein product [Ranitomeya imitator]
MAYYVVAFEKMAAWGGTCDDEDLGTEISGDLFCAKSKARDPFFAKEIGNGCSFQHMLKEWFMPKIVCFVQVYDLVPDILRKLFGLAHVVEDGNQGKHRVTKRGPALSYPMFTLVTGIVGRWRADIVPVYQIKGISKLFKLCLPKVQCFCDSLTSPPSERQGLPNIPKMGKNDLLKMKAAVLFGPDMMNPMLLGATFLAIGLWAWAEKDGNQGKHRVTKRGPALSYPMFTLVTSEDIAGSGVLSNISSITDLGGFDPVWLFMVTGAVMFVLGFAGCIGALRENTSLLKFFSVFLGLIFFLELTAGILAFVFKDWIKDQLNFFINNNVKAYRDDIDLQNLIDFAQEYWSCCGAHGPNDWNLNIYFNCTDSNPSRERCGVPFSCCVKDPAEDVPNTQCGYDVRLKLELEQQSYIYTKGCVGQFEKWLQDNLIVVAGVFVAVALLQMVISFNNVINYNEDPEMA